MLQSYRYRSVNSLLSVNKFPASVDAHESPDRYGCHPAVRWQRHLGDYFFANYPTRTSQFVILGCDTEKVKCFVDWTTSNDILGHHERLGWFDRLSAVIKPQNRIAYDSDKSRTRHRMPLNSRHIRFKAWLSNASELVVRIRNTSAISGGNQSRTQDLDISRFDFPEVPTQRRNDQFPFRVSHPNLVSVYSRNQKQFRNLPGIWRELRRIIAANAFLIMRHQPIDPHDSVNVLLF
jgi:hypothetical protein